MKDTTTWGAKGLLTYGKTVDPATDATVNGAMKHNHRVVCQMMREHGFDYVDGFYHANLKELFSDKLNVHNEEWITSRALRFIGDPSASSVLPPAERIRFYRLAQPPGNSSAP